MYVNVNIFLTDLRTILLNFVVTGVSAIFKQSFGKLYFWYTMASF